MSDWSNPLCGCFSDLTTCIITWICPCYTVGVVAEGVGENKWLCCLGAVALAYFTGLGYIILRTILRGKVRDAKNIDGSLIKDCLLVTFCDLCALVQEKQELDGPGGQSMVRE